MGNLEIQKKISSLEDVDKEIEEVKQRIKLKEAELSNDLKVLPNKLLGYAVSPLSSAVSSFVGGSFLLKTFSVIKNFMLGSTNKKEEVPEENYSGTKSFILDSIKNIGLVSLLKFGVRIIRHI